MRRGVLAALIGLQLLLVLLLALPNLLTLAGGRTLVLDTRPVDPRDLFRGQYVALAYDINTVPDPFGEDVTGRAVFVPLHSGAAGNWNAGTPALSPPPQGLFLRGTVVGRRGDRLRVNYGIEQFFLSETRAPEVERLAGNGLQAEIRVTGGGRATLVRLLQEGQPVAR